MDHFTARPTGGAITRRAWASLGEAVTAMPVLFLSAMALMVGLSVVTFLPGVSALVLAKPQSIAPLLMWRALGAQLAVTLVWAILAAPLAVAMHRFILLGQVTAGLVSYRPRYTLAFIGWLASIRLFFQTVDALPLFLNSRDAAGTVHPSLLAALALLCAGTIFLVADVYLTMLFPAVATQVPSRSLAHRLDISIQEVRGHFWLFVWSFVLALLPVLLMSVLVNFCLLRPVIDASTKNVPIPMLQRVVGAALLGLLQTVSVALAAGVASWLYSWVSRASRFSSGAASG